MTPPQDMGGDVTDSYYWSTVYRWIARDCQLPDPGMYAVVGMAAFLGGSGRITMMLATVVIELTDDASLIGPVGVASIISMVVGNLFNHGLYHGLIPVQNLPFLNTEPSDVMWLVSVVDVMNRKVIALSKSVKPQFIRLNGKAVVSGAALDVPLPSSRRQQRRASDERPRRGGGHQPGGEASFRLPGYRAQ